MNYARSERTALCNTFLRVGPQAPTLCDGWTTADLAAHLVIRDGRPDLAVGMLLPPARGRLDRASQSLAAADWPALVEKVRSGPPAWSPARLRVVDEFVNTGEFYVHHEDVLRAEDGWSTPRELPAAQQRALWHVVQRMATPLTLRSPAPLEFVATAVGSVVIGRKQTRTMPARKQSAPTEPVTVTGPPGELLLFAFGRTKAVVDLAGPDEGVAAVRLATFGF